MESQVTRSHGHKDYEQESHASGMHGQAEHDHGGHHDMKPAVIVKKVKERAKKVKDKIKNHLPGHEHGHQHRSSDEDEGDEEMVESPEVHGAPMYDSERTKTANAGQMQTLGQTGVNVERPFNPSFVGQETNAGTHAGFTTPSMQDNSAFNQATNASPNRNLGRETEGSPGQSRLRPVDFEVDSAAPKSQTAGSTASNYQSKVSDPSAIGGQEIGTAVIDESMGKMTIHDTEPSRKQTNADKTRDAIYSVAPTGSHDQFSPELTPPRPPNTRPLPVPDSLNATKLGDDQPHDSMTDDRPPNMSSYTPTPENPQHDPETYDASKPREQENQSSYTASATSAVADRAVAAKDFVASKLGYGGEKDVGMYGDQSEKSGSFDNTRDTQTNQSGSYAGKISSVAAAIPAAVAGTALSAKNVVASKLGYGRKDESTQEHQIHGEKQHGSSTGSGAEHDRAGVKDEGSSTYAGKITSAAASLPSAVTGTAISAKNVVASKLGYGHSTQGEEQDIRPEPTTEHGKGETAKDQDRGVSKKGYLSEKLKPGDEDKALSELISEALHLQKKDQEKDKQEEKPMGKVTESEEVARRLGTDEDKSAEKAQSSFINTPGGNMVDKLKSWFGPLAPQQSASSGSGQDSGHDSNTGGEKRLQESGN